jgi:hypothetical protein
MQHADIRGFPAYLLGGIPDDFEWTPNAKRRKRIAKPKVAPLTRGARLKIVRDNKRKPKIKKQSRADYREREARRVLKAAIADVFRGDEQ